MQQPFILINFKTYPHGTGAKALELAHLIEDIAQETGVNMAVAVQAVDVRMVAAEVRIPVFGQHFDLAEQGSFTGHVTPHGLKESGAYGSLLNHAERRLSLDGLEESLDLARRLGLFIIACTETPYAGKAIAALEPDLIVVEPPELIGGDLSVCEADPQLVKDAVAMIGKGKVLVGAGVKSGEDVRMALEWGAAGVLVSSAVVRSLEPEKVLRDLAAGARGAKRSA